MDKRTNKLRQTLQMVMLRLQKDLLQRVEVESGAWSDTYHVVMEDPGKLVDSSGKRFALSTLPQVIEKALAHKEKAVVRLVERGTQVRIDLFPGDVKLSFSTQDTPNLGHQQPVESGTRQQFVKVDEALDLLQALDIASPEGKVRADKRRKYYQVDRFVELVDEILEDWQEDRPLTILDCGCGKSYLSFVLNFWLTEKRRMPCRVIGIDGNKSVIETSRKIQRQLGFRNMDFQVSSILDFETDRPIDMVLSLHACDTATDQAMAIGLHYNSKYIISVPCCQAYLRDKLDYSPWQAIAKHNIFRNRLSDVITDGMRAAALEASGYKVSVVEYVSPLDTPKNIMLRAIKGTKSRKQEFEALKKMVDGLLPVESYLLELESR